MKTHDPRPEVSYDELLLQNVPGFGDADLYADAAPFPSSHTKHSFVSGRRDSRAIRVRYFWNASAQQFAGRAWIGPETEGPPGHAHGGSQAALLDEGMGAVAWLAGHTVLAAKIEVNFRKPLPLGTVLTMWATVERVEGRKVYAKARLENDVGTVYSESTGLFIVIDPATLVAKAKN